MARNIGNVVENNFSKGLITEATGLNFPENATPDCLNVSFDNKGLVKRRGGFDFEPNHETNEAVINQSHLTEFIWKGAGATGEINFLVHQVGGVLYFYKIVDGITLSSNIHSYSFNMQVVRIAGSPLLRNERCQYAVGKGYLFVSHPFCDPFYIEYDPDEDEFTHKRIQIKIRDFKGVDDGHGSDYERRPATLLKEHKYNIFNQGWYPQGGDQTDDEGQYYEQFKELIGVYPSNADVWWNGKSPEDEFDATRIDRIAVGNTPAPKGHYILNAFRKDRSAVSGIEGLPVETSKYFRPRCIAFYAGRVWYAGVNALEYSTLVYFSQIIDEISKVGSCHQSQDPTAEDLSDLLDTDGGVIDIQQIGNVITFFTMQSGLLVFATNGVWMISGQQGDSFKATDFSIKQVSSVPVISSSSFVNGQGTPVWWNYDGIYTVQSTNVGEIEVVSMTDKTIDTFFKGIASGSKENAKGAFNPLRKEIQWVYSSVDPGTDIDAQNTYDSLLVFNSLTGAFSPWRITSGELFPDIKGIISLESSRVVYEDAQVVNENGDPIILAGQPVVVSVPTQSPVSNDFKYILNTTEAGFIDNKITFGIEEKDIFRDWTGVNGGEFYDSYFYTGYKIRGNAIQKFQTNYIVVYMNTVPLSSLYVQSIWDYSTSPLTNKEGPWKQCFRHWNLRSVQQKRLKIRGTGRQMQFKFFSEEDRPFELIGWSTFESSNALP